jgi:hypothetical protein
MARSRNLVANPPAGAAHARCRGRRHVVASGKAGEVLALRLAVEVGHPLACQLSGPVGHQHHGLLSLGSAGTVTCPTLGSGPPADITQKGSTWWKTPQAGAGRGGMAAAAMRQWTRSTTRIDGRTGPGRVDGG